jgi:hypothetical protein
MTFPPIDDVAGRDPKRCMGERIDDIAGIHDVACADVQRRSHGSDGPRRPCTVFPKAIASDLEVPRCQTARLFFKPALRRGIVPAATRERRRFAFCDVNKRVDRGARWPHVASAYGSSAGRSWAFTCAAMSAGPLSIFAAARALSKAAAVLTAWANVTPNPFANATKSHWLRTT